MHYDYEIESFVENPKEIKFLYQLRHACNIIGIKSVSKKMKMSELRIDILTNSIIHGSKEIRSCRNMSDITFEKFISELEDEQEEINERQLEHRQQTNNLIHSLEIARKTFCGIGTNKAKRRLNKLSKVNKEASAIRIALEIEDKNIKAKAAPYDYSDRIYKQKNELIHKLIELFNNQNWIYGVQDSDVPVTKHVIYFEIPNCEQLSWHFDDSDDIPRYTKPWDKKINSTLGKLEKITKQLLKSNDLLKEIN